MWQRTRTVWSALSRRAQFLVVALPTLALFVGLLLDLADLWDRITGRSPPAVSVQNVTVSEGGSASLQSPDDDEPTLASATVVSLAVNNPTSAAVAFYRARSEVTGFRALEDCTDTGGYVATTGSYDLPLPVPRPGESAEAALDWEVPAGSNEKIMLTLGNEVPPVERVGVYELSLDLRAGESEWIDAAALVAIERYPLFMNYFVTSDATRGDCVQNNFAAIEESLSAFEGERSAELKAYGELVGVIQDGGSPVSDLCGGEPGTVVQVEPLAGVSVPEDVRLLVNARCGEASAQVSRIGAVDAQGMRVCGDIDITVDGGAAFVRVHQDEVVVSRAAGPNGLRVVEQMYRVQGCELELVDQRRYTLEP